MAELDVVALALVPAVLWGFSPVLSKRGMAAGGSPLQASLVVVVVDSAVYWVAMLATGGIDFTGVTLWALSVFAVAGIIGTAVGRIAVFVGVHRVGASVNSAGISTRPVFATLIALVWLGEPVGAQTALGIVVLVAGLVTLAISRGGDLSGWSPWELVFPVAAALAFGVGNVMRRFGLTTTDATVLQGVAINETAALVVLAAYVLARDREALTEVPRVTYRYFAGSGLITAFALLALFAAFDRGPVAVVDPIAATAPLFTTFFAFFLLRDVERITRGIVIGAGLIVVGGALIVGGDLLGPVI